MELLYLNAFDTCKDMEHCSEDITNINKELSYFSDSLPELIRKMKNVKMQYEKLEMKVQEQVYSSVTTYLGKALIIGGIASAPSTLGPLAAICILGHILITYCFPSELPYTELKDISVHIHEVVTKLQDFNTHCRQAKICYDLMCQKSITYDYKYLYLLGTALNELEMRFNTYCLHFGNMEKQENYKQVADITLHDLDSSIDELISFQQKLYDIRKHLNQMQSLL